MFLIEDRISSALMNRISSFLGSSRRRVRTSMSGSSASGDDSSEDNVLRISDHLTIRTLYTSRIRYIDLARTTAETETESMVKVSYIIDRHKNETSTYHVNKLTIIRADSVVDNSGNELI